MTSAPSVAMSRKPRKYGQMLVMLLIVVAAVGAGGWLYTNNDDAIDVLMVAEPIAAGHEITEADMRTSSKPVLTRGKVSGVEGAVPVSELDEVFGKRAAVPLVPGQVLTYDALTSAAIPAAGTRVVAVSLSWRVGCRRRSRRTPSSMWSQCRPMAIRPRAMCWMTLR